MSIFSEKSKSRALVERWSKVLEHKSFPALKNETAKETVAKLLENQLNYNKTQLAEDAPTNLTGGVQRWDPVLVGMVRRSVPQIVGPEIMGLQTMEMPSGLIFALHVLYGTQSHINGYPNPASKEAWIREPDTAFSGVGSDGVRQPGVRLDSDAENDPFDLDGYTTGRAGNTADFEGDIIAEMSTTVSKINVEVGSRALAASWSTELQQDLQAVHGLDADMLLTNILSDELVGQINRELVRTVYRVAVPGAQTDVTTPGEFDLNVDSNGRWLVEKFKGLMFQLEREANQVFFSTRRGRANIVIASADVASALAEAGMLDIAPILQDVNAGLTPDLSKSTFAGILNKKYRLYIDPYVTQRNFLVCGFKGSEPIDNGLFYCPYVPFQLYRTVDPKSAQPRIAFKTRYAVVSNPVIRKADGSADAQSLTANRNFYYRKFIVKNVM